MSPKEVDSYANLILVCPSDHTKVDQQTQHFGEERLRELKRSHEQWARERGSPTLPRIRIRDPQADKPLLLQRVDSGQQLMCLMAHTLAAHHDHPEPTSRSEVSLLGSFLQNTMDWTNIWDDIGPAGQVDAEFSLTEELRELRAAGFVVYAGTKDSVMEGGAQAPDAVTEPAPEPD